MKSSVFSILTGLTLLLAPMRSDAGAIYPTDGCYMQTDGSGFCWGNFLGYRKDTDPNTYVEFMGNSDSTASFAASWNGKYYTCIPNSTVQPLWPQALANRSHFFISWDKTGNCDSLTVNNASFAGDFN